MGHHRGSFPWWALTEGVSLYGPSQRDVPFVGPHRGNVPFVGPHRGVFPLWALTSGCSLCGTLTEGVFPAWALAGVCSLCGPSQRDVPFVGHHRGCFPLWALTSGFALCVPSQRGLPFCGPSQREFPKGGDIISVGPHKRVFPLRPQLQIKTDKTTSRHSKFTHISSVKLRSKSPRLLPLLPPHCRTQHRMVCQPNCFTLS